MSNRLSNLLNDFVNDETEGFIYLQRYLALIEHVEKRLSVNKQDTPKQYKARNKLNIFFTNKGVETIILPNIQRSGNALFEMPSDMSKMLFLRFIINYFNLSDPNYSTIKSFYPKRNHSTMSLSKFTINRS